jgi:hypothetical protein
MILVSMRSDDRRQPMVGHFVDVPRNLLEIPEAAFNVGAAVHQHVTMFLAHREGQQEAVAEPHVVHPDVQHVLRESVCHRLQ